MRHEYHVVVLNPDDSIKFDITFERVVRPQLTGGFSDHGIPQLLMYRASWVYDLTDGKILKCRNKVYLPLCSQRVDSDWLMQRGFILSNIYAATHQFSTTYP